MSRTGICLVSGIYPPESGGPAKFTSTFSRWLLSHDYSVSVVTLTDQADYFEKINELSVMRISRNRNLLLRYLTSARYIFRYSKNRVIVANGMFLEVLICKIFTGRRYFTKIPGDIVWERAKNSNYTSLNINDFQNSHLNLKYRIFRYFFSKSLKMSEGVIVPSHHLYQLVLSWGINPQKIKLVFNSISLDIFEFNSKNSRDIDVLTVSRLVKWKGLDEVIKACGKLSLNLTIVGSGPERDRLEKIAIQYGTSVKFVGEVSQSQLPSYYARAKYFVLNSTFEATSYALLEARSCGAFSIANSQTGSEDVIKHLEDGLLCGDTTGLDIESALEYAVSHEFFVEDARSKARLRTEKLFNLENNFADIFRYVTQ